MFGWFKKNTNSLAGSSSNPTDLLMRADSSSQSPVEPKLRLVDVVAKTHKTEFGPFEDLNRDLAHFMEKNYKTCDPMLKMAYGYARRTAMCGMYFQRIVKQNVVNHVQDIFTALQSTTGQTVTFQREAAAQATDILQAYVPRLSREHDKALFHYARTGVNAVELADAHSYSAIDEIEDFPVPIDKCLDLIDYVIRSDQEAAKLFDPSPTSSISRPRLIDLVEKTSTAQLGAFARMCDDIKVSGPKIVGDDVLWAASGYAYLLGACAVFVGGGVHPRLVTDAVEMSNTLMAGVKNKPGVFALCKEQAVALAMTYATRFTAEAADVILEKGLKFEPFVSQGEGRISPEEVVLRARRIARELG